jgi:hypothetical protein
MAFDWHDCVPAPIAEWQASWDRKMQVLRMKQCGLRLVDIGERLGVSGSRARQLAVKAEKYVRQGRMSPVEEYFAGYATINKDGQIECHDKPYRPDRPDMKLRFVET